MTRLDYPIDIRPRTAVAVSAVRQMLRLLGHHTAPRPNTQALRVAEAHKLRAQLENQRRAQIRQQGGGASDGAGAGLIPVASDVAETSPA